jgi:hypothetical protein
MQDDDSDDACHACAIEHRRIERAGGLSRFDAVDTVQCVEKNADGCQGSAMEPGGSVTVGVAARIRRLFRSA